MPALFSTEGQLETGLRALNCSGRNFEAIAGSLGVHVSHGSFSEALSGKKPFSVDVGDRLLDILGMMTVLQSEISLPVHWAATQKVSDALAVRLVAKIAKELHCETVELEQAAARQTEQVTR